MYNKEIKLQLLLDVASLNAHSPKPDLMVSARLLVGLHVEGDSSVPQAPGISRRLLTSQSTPFGPRGTRKIKQCKCLLSWPRTEKKSLYSLHL